jgi:hypothetical protein
MGLRKRPVIANIPRWLGGLALLIAMMTAVGARPADRPADLVLKGEITGFDMATYRRVTFTVPPGIKRLTLSFSYTGKAEKTAIDIGLIDSQRFRGWSGGARGLITLSAEEATPSYLPGPIPPGRWTLLLGVPNIRKGARSSYEARVFLDRDSGVAGFEPDPLSDQAKWYRGDLHMHTAHSDGVCAGQGGVRAPCPVYRTLEAAAARGLDFIAITDHNATSQFEAERELQPAFPKLLLIPGREITTFRGHANLFGPTAFIDFRLTDPAVPSMDELLKAAAASGGVFSVNHPMLPSGESCMGCGWTAADTDYSRVQAIEVVNGGALSLSGAADGTFSGIPFWEAKLNAGYRLTALGGSDNHDAGLDPAKASAIGRPTTVIHAQALSTAAILEGIRAGQVFIDVDGTADRMLDLTASAGEQSARMGGAISAPKGSAVHFIASLEHLPAGRIELIMDGRPATPTTHAGERIDLDWPSDGARHWFRVNGRDAAGRLVLIGNPIYVNFPDRR